MQTVAPQSFQQYVPDQARVRSWELFDEEASVGAYFLSKEAGSSLKGGVLLMPHTQFIKYERKDLGDEGVFFTHCYPCLFYKTGQCRGGNRILSRQGSRLRVFPSTDNYVTCLLKNKPEIHASMAVREVTHPILYSRFSINADGDGGTRYLYRVDPDSMNNGIDHVKIRPYLLSNVYSDSGRVCLGRETSDLRHDILGRNGTSFYDTALVNADLMPRSMSIHEWVSNYDQLEHYFYNPSEDPDRDSYDDDDDDDCAPDGYKVIDRWCSGRIGSAYPVIRGMFTHLMTFDPNEGDAVFVLYNEETGACRVTAYSKDTWTDCDVSTVQALIVQEF